MQNLLLQNRNNSAKFWSTIKRSRPRGRNRAEISIGVWKEHFEKVLGQHSASMNVHEDQINEQNEDDVYVYELDEDMSLLEVKQVIRKLKCGKAPGSDEIPAEFLKAAEDILL